MNWTTPLPPRESNHLLKPLAIAAVLTAITACGDPAPGEGVKGPVGEEPLPKVVSASEAIHTPNYASLDPATLQDSEISKVVPEGARCSFAYTKESGPIFSAGKTDKGSFVGVIKIHGRLVELSAPQLNSFSALTEGAEFRADDMSFEVAPKQQQGKQREANAHFTVRDKITVGYGGWYSCSKGQ